MSAPKGSEGDDEFYGSANPVIPEMFSTEDIDEVADEYSWETRRRAMWMKRDPRVAIELVSDLVNFQLESFQNTQSYHVATDYIAQNPEKMVNRLLVHLQYLFDIRDLQGLVPKMNQIYLSVEESRNFLVCLKESLHMKDSQNSAVMTETLRRIGGQEQIVENFETKIQTKRGDHKL